MIDPCWADYLKALNKCCDAARLSAHHTREAAKQVEKAADYTMLTAFHAREILEVYEEDDTPALLSS